MNINDFKLALAEALSNCPPVRRRIIKKKLLKNKVSLTELEAFIAAYAPAAYRKLHSAK